MASKAKHRRAPVSAFGFVVGFLLVIYSLGLIALLLWAVNTSLKTDDNYFLDQLGLTKTWSFPNYVNSFKAMRVQVNARGGGKRYAYFWEMFLNSVLYAGGAAFFQTFTTALVAYLTSRYHNWVSKVIHNTVIVTMLIPVVGSLASTLQMAVNLHIYDQLWGMYILKIGFNNIYYLIFYAAFSRIPDDYTEAAYLEGASHWRIFSRVMLPIQMPLVGVVFLLLFIGYWNDYQVPLLFIPDYPTLAVGLFQFLNNDTTTQMASVPYKVTGGVLVLIPLLILFLIFKKQLMANIDDGGIKG